MPVAGMAGFWRTVRPVARHLSWRSRGTGSWEDPAQGGWPSSRVSKAGSATAAGASDVCEGVLAKAFDLRARLCPVVRTWLFAQIVDHVRENPKRTTHGLQLRREAIGYAVEVDRRHGVLGFCGPVPPGTDPLPHGP